MGREKKFLHNEKETKEKEMITHYIGSNLLFVLWTFINVRVVHGGIRKFKCMDAYNLSDRIFFHKKDVKRETRNTEKQKRQKTHDEKNCRERSLCGAALRHDFAFISAIRELLGACCSKRLRRTKGAQALEAGLSRKVQKCPYDESTFSLSMVGSEDSGNMLMSSELIELLILALCRSSAVGAECSPYGLLLDEFMDRSWGSSSPLQLLLSDEARSARASDRRMGVMVPVGEARARSSAGDICKSAGDY